MSKQDPIGGVEFLRTLFGQRARIKASGVARNALDRLIGLPAWQRKSLVGGAPVQIEFDVFMEAAQRLFAAFGPLSDLDTDVADALTPHILAEVETLEGLGVAHPAAYGWRLWLFWQVWEQRHCFRDLFEVVEGGLVVTENIMATMGTIELCGTPAGAPPEGLPGLFNLYEFEAYLRELTVDDALVFAPDLTSISLGQKYRRCPPDWRALVAAPVDAELMLEVLACFSSTNREHDDLYEIDDQSPAAVAHASVGLTLAMIARDLAEDGFADAHAYTVRLALFIDAFNQGAEKIATLVASEDDVHAAYQALACVPLVVDEEGVVGLDADSLDATAKAIRERAGSAADGRLNS